MEGYSFLRTYIADEELLEVVVLCWAPDSHEPACVILIDPRMRTMSAFDR
jgi:hypothetical protein